MRARILAMHMVRVRKKSADETAADLLQSGKWVRNWLGRYDRGAWTASGISPGPAGPEGSTGDDRRHNRPDDPVRAHPVCPAAEHTRGGRDKTAHHLRQKDPVPARPVSQEATKGPRQQGRQKGRLGLAVPHQDADFMSGGGRICSGHAGRVVLHTRRRDGPHVLGAQGQADPRPVHRKPQEDHRQGSTTPIKIPQEVSAPEQEIRILYFPKGSPHLNAVEECWNQDKRMLLVSEYHKTFSDMRHAASTYYRTITRFNLELLKYANRKIELACTNL